MKKEIEYIDGKEIETIIFSETDLNLLSQEVNLSPCATKCAYLSSMEKAVCCGCPERRKWEEKVKPYKDRGILDYALQLTNIRLIRQKYGPESYPYKDAVVELPNKLREII